MESFPKYNEFMLPILRLIQDQKTCSMKDVRSAMIDHFNLSEDQLRMCIPSGPSLLHSRTGWAKTYLSKAGLLEQPQRAHIQITKSGLDALASDISEINRAYLSQFEGFHKFQERSSRTPKGNDPEQEINESTPEERLTDAYSEIRSLVEDSLLERLRASDPFEFEKIVLKAMGALGYGNQINDESHTTKKSGDEGIDGVINEDALGLDRIYLQAKRWKEGNTVSRSEVQKFAGALQGKGASKGVFITTSHFSSGAMQYADALANVKIVLIDGNQLTHLLYEHGVGMTDEMTYTVKRIDQDFFED